MQHNHILNVQPTNQPTNQYVHQKHYIIINSAVKHTRAAHHSQSLLAYIKTPPQNFQYTI